MNNILNLTNCWLFFKKKMILRKNYFLIAILSINLTIVFFFFITVGSFHRELNINNYSGFIVPFLYIFGFVSAGYTFIELHKPSYAIHELTLPVSILERYLIGLFISIVVYIVMAIFSIFFINLFIKLLSYLVWGDFIPILNPFDSNFLSIYINFIYMIPIFILGSIYFKKNHFFKTILFIVILLTLYVIYNVSLVNLLFNTTHLDQIFQNNNFFYLEGPIKMPNLFKYKHIIFPIFSIIILIAGYFRLKEKEV